MIKWNKWIQKWYGILNKYKWQLWNQIYDVEKVSYYPCFTEFPEFCWRAPCLAWVIHVSVNVESPGDCFCNNVLIFFCASYTSADNVKFYLPQFQNSLSGGLNSFLNSRQKGETKRFAFFLIENLVGSISFFLF